MHIDVSRAYFHAKAQSPVLIRLPVEDRVGTDAGKVGLMKKSTSGTGGSNLDSDWRICFTTKKLIEFVRKMTSVYPIKAKIIGYGSPNVDVLVKDLGLEHGNSVQTPATPDVTEEEETEPLSQVQQHKYRSQVARCLFLSQDRSRHNIHRERVVPRDVESQSAEACQAEKACQVLET